MLLLQMLLLDLYIYWKIWNFHRTLNFIFLMMNWSFLFDDCPEKFREIYNYAFGWAKEKVHNFHKSRDCYDYYFKCTQMLRSGASWKKLQLYVTDIIAFHWAILMIIVFLLSISGSEIFGTGHCHWNVAITVCREWVAVGWSLVPVLTGSA